jgi:hypothetical protein
MSAMVKRVGDRVAKLEAETYLKSWEDTDI